MTTISLTPLRSLEDIVRFEQEMPLQQRISAQDHYGQLMTLMRREVGAIPATNGPRWIKVVTENGPLRALAFVVDTKGPTYAGKHSIEQVARVLAKAAGHLGSAAQYLYNTVSKLESHGIRDKNLWEIQKLVAREIDKAFQGSDQP